MKRAQRLYGFHTALIYLFQKSFIVFAFTSVDFFLLKKMKVQPFIFYKCVWSRWFLNSDITFAL